MAKPFDLVSADGNAGRAAVEGWIRRPAAVALFEMAGLDFDDLKAQAADRSFRPVPLGVTGRTRIRNSSRTIDSQNFVAKLEGSERPDEVVLYVAHWDHLGRDETLDGDQIFNGAADNATGTAGLIELARAFVQANEPPERSILFLAVTAEEQGLLGSKHYGANPLYPAAQTVAALNMDVLNQWGRTRDMTIVGLGQSEIDRFARDVGSRLGRTLRPDPEPEKGFYYRSDHFSFARAGIPAFYADPGIEYLDKPDGYGITKREEYTANDYHKVSDEVKPDWGLVRSRRGPDVHVRARRGLGRERRVARLEPDVGVSSAARTTAPLTRSPRSLARRGAERGNSLDDRRMRVVKHNVKRMRSEIGEGVGGQLLERRDEVLAMAGCFGGEGVGLELVPPRERIDEE